eukprot:6031367-Prymnesium_polylepis.1
MSPATIGFVADDRAVMSSSDSVQEKRSTFSFWCVGLLLLGMTGTPSCTCHLSATCGPDLPYLAPMDVTRSPVMSSVLSVPSHGPQSGEND